MSSVEDECWEVVKKYGSQLINKCGILVNLDGGLEVEDDSLWVKNIWLV